MFSADPWSFDLMSGHQPSELEFGFDDEVVNSLAYRRILAKTMAKKQAVPQEVVSGDLIDLSDDVPVEGQDAQESQEGALRDLMGMVFLEDASPPEDDPEGAARPIQKVETMGWSLDSPCTGRAWPRNSTAVSDKKKKLEWLSLELGSDDFEWIDGESEGALSPFKIISTDLSKEQSERSSGSFTKDSMEASGHHSRLSESESAYPFPEVGSQKRYPKSNMPDEKKEEDNKPMDVTPVAPKLSTYFAQSNKVDPVSASAARSALASFAAGDTGNVTLWEPEAKLAPSTKALGGTMDPLMFTDQSLIEPEPEEERHQRDLRAAAVSMAEAMYQSERAATPKNTAGPSGEARRLSSIGAAAGQKHPAVRNPDTKEKASGNFDLQAACERPRRRRAELTELYERRALERSRESKIESEKIPRKSRVPVQEMPLVSRQAERNMENFDGICLGDGKFMSEAELLAVARAKLQSEMEEINNVAKKLRARDEATKRRTRRSPAVITLVR